MVLRKHFVIGLFSFSLFFIYHRRGSKFTRTTEMGLLVGLDQTRTVQAVPSFNSWLFIFVFFLLLFLFVICQTPDSNIFKVLEGGVKGSEKQVRLNNVNF